GSPVEYWGVMSDGTVRCMAYPFVYGGPWRDCSSSIRQPLANLERLRMYSWQPPLSPPADFQDLACALLRDHTVRCGALFNYFDVGYWAPEFPFDDPIWHIAWREEEVILQNVPGITEAQQLAIGRLGIPSRQHACVLIRDGFGQCWGPNGYGQLGDGTTQSTMIPVAINW